MKTILSIIGIAAALVMAAVSAAMNYAFLASLGKSEIEGQILGAASASADLLKVLLPFFIAWAWREQRFVAALSGGGVFTLFAGFSLLSAIGFAASNRGAVAEGRVALDGTYARVQQEFERKTAARSALPTGRPATVIAEELRAAEQSRLWTRTKNCSEATEPASRAFCDAFYRLRAEQAAAEEATRLDSDIAALGDELARLKAEGAGQARDAQVSTLSGLFRLPEDQLRLALIVAVALVVELGSSLGLYLAAGPFTGPIAGSNTKTSRPEPEIARAVGDIEDFCLEALVASNSGAMSVQDVGDTYAAWCKRQNWRPLDREAFEQRFSALAAALGLVLRNGEVQGLAPAPIMKSAAA
jgi:uncharacterized small protein (DUF1192 family)